MAKMVILRGISGQGKSTLANNIRSEWFSKLSKKRQMEELFKEDCIYSSDKFFIDPTTDKYNFNPNNLRAAHEWNRQRVQHAIAAGRELIIVDNTNTQAWEAAPYIKMGKDAGYDIEIMEPNTPWKNDAEELYKRNVHNVPLETIKKMLGRWQPLDEFKKELGI